MSKKDFIALADALRISRPDASDCESGNPDNPTLANWIKTRDKIADVCKARNARFNRERWIAYINGECGPSGGSVRK